MTEMNDLELTLNLIELGIKEASGLYNTWKKRQRYDNKDSRASLHKTALMAYESHEFALKPNGKLMSGSKSRNILGLLREEFIKKEDGRANNKRKPTEEEIILYEYIFNQLLNIKLNKPLPYRGWATRVALFDVSKVSNKEFYSKTLELINDLHIKTLGYDKSYSNEALSFFKEMIYRRNEDVVKAAFSYLEGLGKIEITTSYHVYETSRNYKLITEEFYNQLKHEEEVIVSDSKMDIQSYRNMKNRPYKRTDFYLEVSKRVKSHMKEKHKINYYFTGVKVKLLCDDPFEEISNYQKDRIYKSILVKRTVSRGNRTDYKHSGEFKKVWYTLNTFILLKEMGIDIPIELFDSEMKKLDKDQKSAMIFEERLSNEIEETFSLFG